MAAHLEHRNYTCTVYCLQCLPCFPNNRGSRSLDTRCLWFFHPMPRRSRDVTNRVRPKRQHRYWQRPSKDMWRQSLADLWRSLIDIGVLKFQSKWNDYGNSISIHILGISISNWLVVWNHGILWLSIHWECHHPNWRSHIFQRGRYTTKQSNFNDPQPRWPFRTTIDTVEHYCDILWYSWMEIADETTGRPQSISTPRPGSGSTAAATSRGEVNQSESLAGHLCWTCHNCSFGYGLYGSKGFTDNIGWWHRKHDEPWTDLLWWVWAGFFLSITLSFLAVDPFREFWVKLCRNCGAAWN